MTVAILGLSTAALAQVEDNSHQSYKRFSWDYCTYYAAQVFDRFAATEGGIDWRGNGDEWLCAAQEQGWHLSTNPRDARIGAIIVWRNAGRGHVAVVDDVYADGILISEMNWHINSDGEATGGFNRISQSFLPFSTNLNRGVRRRYFF
ncbi:MAG: CHAP domain-containing protein, partial [Acidobacteriota bacterium]